MPSAPLEQEGQCLMVRCLPAGRPEDSGISLQIIQVNLQPSCGSVLVDHGTHLAEQHIE
jgi:hypothetical protein